MRSTDDASFSFRPGAQSLRVLRRPGVKERSIPNERNTVEADLEAIVTDDHGNQKKHKGGDPGVINRHAVVIDRVVGHEIET